jgi:Glycosyltransferase family 87
MPPVPRLLAPSRRAPLWALAAGVAVLTWLQMVRRPADPPLWDSFLTEDGGVFFGHAVDNSFRDSVTAGYLGYLHTAPRLIAEPATWFSFEHAPLVMSLLTCLVAGLLAAYVFEASSPWIASPLLRFVLAASVVLAPVTAREMNGTVANLHWYLIFAATWAVVSPWRGRGWLVVSAAVVGLAALSDPLTGVLLPIGIVLAWRARERRAWVLPGLIAVALMAHLVLRDDSAERFGSLEASELPRIFAERVTTSLLAGDRYMEDLFGGQTGSPFAWATLAVVVVGVGVGLWRLRGRRRWLLGGGAALSIVFFMIPVLRRGTEVLLPASPWLGASSRYVYLPILFLLTGLLAAFDREGARLRWREVAVAVLVLAAVAVSYRAPNRTEGGATWKAELAKAERFCVGKHPDEPARIRIIPLDWQVEIDCGRLD